MADDPKDEPEPYKVGFGCPPLEARFQPGNPGRPKGSRNKLGEQFTQDMLADWEIHGAATIVKVRETKPDQYLKVVSSILPKELNVRINELDDLTDDQLARQYLAIAESLVAAGVGLGAGDPAPPRPEQIN
jgi:hypothetical protein